MTVAKTMNADELAKSALAIQSLAQTLALHDLPRRIADDGYQVLDPNVAAKTLALGAIELMAQPQRLWATQFDLWSGFAGLALNTALPAAPRSPVIEPAPGDKRFKAEAWQQDLLFDTIKQAYLLAARAMEATGALVGEGDARRAHRTRFYLRQIANALAPTNFAATNPQVLQATLDSGGRNLVDGLIHLLRDLHEGEGRLRLKMTDASAFRLGENIAATPGKVIFQNELMQLLQYAPSTEHVHKRPLLIMPPWINKFYILDLKPQNSFIRWAVAQGHTVFVVSWVNPDASLAERNFEDYMLQGPLAALDAIEQATGAREVNAIGYCIGGTLLASTLAWMATRGDRRVKSATFFTTLLDFADVGDLSVFIDDEQLALMERHMQRLGTLEGKHMGNAFNLLRENDLLWSFVVNNYLLGREPPAFDMLYWNADTTHMPAAMHAFYVRNMYLENRLREPGGITLAGTPIDLRRIAVPRYFLSTAEDHIAPWKSTYAGARLGQGPVRFVLGGSGHIAGVVNPPPGKKYGHWTNASMPASPDEWFAGAEQHASSWWDDWAAWVKPHAGKRVPARHPGDGALAAIEDAPGTYVRVRRS